MNAIMMYMSGNTLQIFSMMMVFTLFKNPFQALLQTNQIFARYETEGTKGKMWMVKLTYVAMNLVALGLGIWKVNGMGLLPCVLSFREVAEQLLLTARVGRRPRIGWRGKLQGYHLKIPSLRSNSLTILEAVLLKQPLFLLSRCSSARI